MGSRLGRWTSLFKGEVAVLIVGCSVNCSGGVNDEAEGRVVKLLMLVLMLRPTKAEVIINLL